VRTVTAQHYKSCGKKSREGMPGEESLEASSETDIEGVDMICWGQTVPSMGNSNREGPIADSLFTYRL